MGPGRDAPGAGFGGRKHFDAEGMRGMFGDLRLHRKAQGEEKNL